MSTTTRTEGVLEVLRRPSTDHAVFRGFGPLVVAVLFAVLLITLLPSVAPERIVEAPVEAPTEDADGEAGR